MYDEKKARNDVPSEGEGQQPVACDSASGLRLGADHSSWNRHTLQKSCGFLFSVITIAATHRDFLVLDKIPGNARR